MVREKRPEYVPPQFDPASWPKIPLEAAAPPALNEQTVVTGVRNLTI